MSDRERRIRQRLKDEFPHYAAKCLKIRTKAGGIEPLILNTAQRHLHAEIERQRIEMGRVRALVVKGRQQGSSTYVEAEYFESLDGSTILLGTSVALVGDKIRPAVSSDDPRAILGVVRPKGEDTASTVVGGTAWNEWTQKFLTDRFGRKIRETYKVIEWSEYEEVDAPEGGVTRKLKQNHCYAIDMIPNGLVPPNDAVVKSTDADSKPLLRPKLNPAYDPNKAYVPRDGRPEWHIIGLMGQVPLLKGQPVGDRWIKMRAIDDEVELWLVR